MKEYIDAIKQKTNITPKNVLEIGSRDADDAEIMRKSFDIKEENVYIVEPNPNQMKKIKSKYPRFKTFEYAISKIEKESFFYSVIDENFVGISSLIDRNDNFYSKVKTEKIKIYVKTGLSLLEDINTEIDLCKIDVEGLTYEVLESFSSKIKKIKSFHLECEHIEIWKNQKLYKNVSNLMNLLGYEEIYFNYCGGGKIQSDTVWVLKEYIL